MTYADTTDVDWHEFAHAEDTRREAERIDAEYHAGHVDELLAELRAAGHPGTAALADLFEVQRRIWRRHRAAEHFARVGGVRGVRNNFCRRRDHDRD